MELPIKEENIHLILYMCPFTYTLWLLEQLCCILNHSLFSSYPYICIMNIFTFYSHGLIFCISQRNWIIFVPSLFVMLHGYCIHLWTTRFLQIIHYNCAVVSYTNSFNIIYHLFIYFSPVCSFFTRDGLFLGPCFNMKNYFEIFRRWKSIGQRLLVTSQSRTQVVSNIFIIFS